MAQTHQRPHLKATPRLQAVNGTAIQIIGQTEIQIDLIPDPVPVIIAENIPHKMKIGDEFLRLGGAILDLGNNSMTWFGRRWSMQRSHPITNDSFGPTTPMTGNAEIDRLVRNNSNLFSAKGEPIGDSQLEALSINTNSRPICQKAYRTRLTKRKIVEDSIAEMLRDDIIEPTSSPWASPILLVKKKDGLEHRFSIDFRRVNAVTERDQYPMANISEIFDLLGGSKIFSTLDLKSGYWQLPVAIKDRPKTAFRCHLGLFQCKRIPFGLCNAPAVFQRAMDKLLTGLAYRFVYTLMISSCSAKTWQIMKNIYSVYSIAYVRLGYGYSLPNALLVSLSLSYWDIWSVVKAFILTLTRYKPSATTSYKCA